VEYTFDSVCNSVCNRPPESVFEMMDEDGNGRVGKDEFVEGLKVCGLDLPAEETDLLWDFLDDDGGGDLDTHEMCSKLMVHYKKEFQDDQEAAAAELAASEQMKARSSVFLAAAEGAASEQRKARSSVFLDSLQSTSEERLLELAHLGVCLCLCVCLCVNLGTLSVSLHPCLQRPFCGKSMAANANCIEPNMLT